MQNGYLWVITVTAGTVDRSFAGLVFLGDGIEIVGWLTYSSNNSPQNRPLVYNKTLSRCDSLAYLVEAISGIIVCELGKIGDQLSLVTNSNVAGAIFISNIQPLNTSCPCVFITTEDAKILMRFIESTSAPNASLNFHETTMNLNLAPTVAAYASRGPSFGFANIVKPDVTAPGSRVLGAWNPNIPAAKIGRNTSLYSYYTMQSGTSLASPRVAGLAALLKGVHPAWSPATIRSKLCKPIRHY